MKKPLVPDSEESLGLRAAWLHYVGGLTQAAVAKRLGLPSVKTHRLIARAVAEGAVKVTIDGDIVACVELESRLCARFGLNFCRVTPDLAEEGLPLRALGLAGAEYLRNLLSNNPDITIGIGHGRTLSAAIHQLPHLDASHARFVSLLGCLTRNYALNPHDVMHRIAEKTGAQAYMMPVPFFANTVEDREVLLSQRGVSEVFSMAAGSTVKLVGIGDMNEDSYMVKLGWFTPQEISNAGLHQGVIGDIAGYDFFNARGEHVNTVMDNRVIGLNIDELRQIPCVIAIASENTKAMAIMGALRTGAIDIIATSARNIRTVLSLSQ
ncbi:sugar-binding transcriptional regulator [Escherichia coli]